MPPTPTYVLQLSTEELWEIIDYIPNPLEILTLSLVSKRFANVTRDDSVWRRHLTLGGWNVDAIIRHSRTEYEDRQAGGIWVNLARAACARWHVLRPGYDQKPSTWTSRFQGWRLWKRVAWPDYIRKLDAVTSEIDSDSHFFEETESVARFLASRRPENFEDECTGYRRLMVIARYMYHDVSLGKAFQPGYQQWPIICSHWLTSKADLSVNHMVAQTLKEFCRNDDPQALRYVNRALDLFMTLLQDMIRCAAEQSPEGIDYRRVFPRRTVPDITWLTTSPKGFPRWIRPQGRSWWSLDGGTMKLEGYYVYRFFLDDDTPLDAPMTMTLSRGKEPNAFRGTGYDGVGSFEINGTVDGAVVTFRKDYPGLSWQYSGILLPWALVGVWHSPGEWATPDGDFCLWLVE